MALFKILQGTVNNLNATNNDGSAKVPYHEGYCYFTTDEGKLYIDAVDKRICLHAEKADFADRLGQYTIGGYNKPIYLSNGVPVVCDNFLPLSAGEENKITGALGLGDAMYGSDLPNNSFEGQLFFLENNEENNFVIDNTMSPTSTNPVQNKVIYEAINSIKGLPSYTTSNDGQILRIVNGVPAWSAIPIAEEANF